MAKVEAIKRTKNQRAELVQAYKVDITLNDMPNDDDTEEDDSSSESENLGEEWKNYKDINYITDKGLEIVLQKAFEENTVWDFSYLKNGITIRNPFILCIVHVVKLTNYGWRKKTYYTS